MDTIANIKLEMHKPNHVTYKYSNVNQGFAVFSEMYYPKGWNVFVDGKITEHIRANYVLRGMVVPAGNHTIEFKFEPEVVKTGSTISLICSILTLFLLLFGCLYEYRKSTF